MYNDLLICFCTTFEHALQSFVQTNEGRQVLQKKKLFHFYFNAAKKQKNEYKIYDICQMFKWSTVHIWKIKSFEMNMCLLFTL